MDKSRQKSRLGPLLSLTGIVITVLAIYVAGYFFCGTVSSTVNPRLRDFRWKSLWIVYAPMAMLEARLLGAEVWLSHTPDPGRYAASYRTFQP